MEAQHGIYVLQSFGVGTFVKLQSSLSLERRTMQRLPMRCRTSLTGARAGMRRSSARSSATAPASSPRSASSCSASGARTPLRISLPCVGSAALRKPGTAGSELASCTPCPQGAGTRLCTTHSWCFNSAFSKACKGRKLACQIACICAYTPKHAAQCLCGLQGDQGSRCGALLVHPRHVPGAGGAAVHLPLAPGPPLRPCCGHRAVRDVCGGAPGNHHPGEARAPPPNLQTGVYPEGCTCICCMLDAHCQASICHPGVMTGPSFDCALGCGQAARH